MLFFAHYKNSPTTQAIRKKGGPSYMTNKNDNRERKNKYPNNKQNEEFSKDVNIRSEITKKDMKK